jgi:hypothetical protein
MERQSCTPFLSPNDVAMQGCQRKPRSIRAGCPYEWIRRADEPGLVPYLWTILVELVFLELGALGRNFGPIVASMGTRKNGDYRKSSSNGSQEYYVHT